MGHDEFFEWWEELEAVLDRKPDDVKLMSLDGHLRAFDPDELDRYLSGKGPSPDSKADYYGYGIDGGGS